MNRKQLTVVATALVLAAGGLGAGLGIGLSGAPGAPAQALKPASAKASYAYYLAVAKRYAPRQSAGYGGMMGGGYSWMMGASCYSWMMGGSGAPGWMMGGCLPGSFTQGSDSMGKVMGRLFAGAPGPRVSPAQAAQLGTEVPSGATADRSTNTVTFSGQDVSFAVLASPSMPAESFKIARLTDPTVVVAEGAHVSIELVNADDDMAHGLVLSGRVPAVLGCR